MTKHIHREIKRSKAEQARLKALRDSFQKQRPSLETLAQSSEYSEPMPLGEFLDAKAIASALKEMRQQVKMSLAEVSAKTGMDRAAISRLENGVNARTCPSWNVSVHSRGNAWQKNASMRR